MKITEKNQSIDHVAPQTTASVSSHVENDCIPDEQSTQPADDFTRQPIASNLIATDMEPSSPRETLEYGNDTVSGLSSLAVDNEDVEVEIVAEQKSPNEMTLQECLSELSTVTPEDINIAVQNRAIELLTPTHSNDYYHIAFMLQKQDLLIQATDILDSIGEHRRIDIYQWLHDTIDILLSGGIPEVTTFNKYFREDYLLKELIRANPLCYEKLSPQLQQDPEIIQRFIQYCSDDNLDLIQPFTTNESVLRSLIARIRRTHNGNEKDEAFIAAVRPLCADPSMLNESFILETLHETPSSCLLLDDTVLHNEDFWYQAIHYNPSALQYCPEAMFSQAGFVERLATESNRAIPYIHKSQRSRITDQQLLACLARSNYNFNRFSAERLDQLMADESLWFMACLSEPRLLEHIPKEHDRFNEYALTAIEHCLYFNQLAQIAPLVIHDRQLLLATLEFCGKKGWAATSSFREKATQWLIDSNLVVDSDFILSTSVSIGSNALRISDTTSFTRTQWLDAITHDYKAFNLVPISLRTDSSFHEQAVGANPQCLYILATTDMPYRSSWVDIAIENNLTIEAIHPDYLSDETIMQAIARYDKNAYNHAGENLQASRDFTLYCAQHGNFLSARKTPPEFFNDPEIMRAAILQHPEAFLQAGPQVAADPDLVLLVLQLCGRDPTPGTYWVDLIFDILKVIDSDLWADPDFQRQAIQTNYNVLGNISPQERQQSGLLREQIALFGELIRFAPEELLQDRELVRNAIMSNSAAYHYLPQELQEDFELARLAVLSEPWAFTFLPDEFRENQELIELSVRNYAANNLSYIRPSDIWSDPEQVQHLFILNAQVIDYIDITLLQDIDFLCQLAQLYPPVLDCLPIKAVPKEALLLHDPELATLYERYQTRMQSLQIEHPMRFKDRATLDAILATRETSSYNTDLPEAVVLYPKEDHNESLTIHPGFLQLMETYNVHYFEVGNESDFIQTLQNIPTGATDLLLIGAHGNRQASQFSSGSLALNEDVFLDLTDRLQLEEANITRALAPQAEIILESCLVGAGGSALQNMTNLYADIFEGHTVSGPLFATSGIRFYDPISGQFNPKYYEGYGMLYQAQSSPPFP